MRIVRISAAVAVALMLAGCGSDGVEMTSGSALNPKSGLVDVGHGVAKFCDGPTLVYRLTMINRGGLSVIPNSPECAP